ncbi:hypothetical protein [Sandarakinorhabdus sp. DWP1-3-1]|uniref:hypothetical protein n=1 Tax=Sandarakinorhabdus sp. DWP1-3-1 TaxID=2804627 RepID=UPI003CF9D987
MREAASTWASQDAGTLPWLAVAGYLVGAGLCLWRRGGAGSGRERLFWLAAALAMLALGLNKQLDLQTLLTGWGRQMARDGGWYAQRRAYQKEFVIGVALVAMVIGAGLAWLVRGLSPRVLAALAGLGLLGAFVLVRLASFHHIDVAMRTPVQGLKLHTVLELVGIAIVIGSAAWPQAARPARPGRR